MDRFVALTRLPLLALCSLAAGSLAVSCSGDDAPGIESRDIAAEAVAGRSGAAIASIITMRADASVTTSADGRTTAIAESAADIDLRAGTATSEASVTAEAGGDGRVEQTVVVGDRALGRQPGGPWEPSDQSLVSVALPGFGQEGADVADALRAIVLDATGPWIATTDDDGTTYTSDDPTTGQSLELEIDGRGHLVRVARTQPPLGARVDFSEFDRTIVEVPSDLPPE